MSDSNNLFLRQATGLVRSWSVFDAFIYATFSINLITLGLYIFSFAPYLPDAHLVPAVVVAGIFVMFVVIVYAMMISVLPRAGGDYVWQSRILGGGIGFVMALTGWVLILWLWVPLYGNMMVWNVFTPLLTLLGSITGSQALMQAGLWFGETNGLFAGSLIVIGLAFFLVSIGMSWYARIQKFCFFLGMAGLVTVFVLLLANGKADFINGFNGYVLQNFGAANAYETILQSAEAGGYVPIAWNNMGIMASLPLIPMVVFFILWPNWGSTLYGEVRGATEFKKNFNGMGLGVVVTTVLAVVLFSLINKTFGWDFYLAANYAFYEGVSPYPIFPFPGLLAAYLTTNPLLQLWVIVALSGWFFGWCGTVFLSSTRVLFAAAFDRMLPEWVARINPATRSPINALIIMTIPSIIVSFLFFYMPGFDTWTMNSTAVLTLTFLVTTVAAIILPYQEKELYNSSPIAKYTVFGLPAISVAGVILALFLIFNLVMWFKDDVYGINNPISTVFMLVLYGLAIGAYWYYRRQNVKQGVNMEHLYKQIPLE
jgi:amino acid transporter